MNINPIVVGTAPILRSIWSVLTMAVSAFICLAPASLLQGAVLNVGDYPSIQGAINAASGGDTIVIPAGTYAEELLLNKALFIRGANFGIAAGANPGARGAETVINGGFIVSATGASIDGITIQNGRMSGSFRVGIAVTTSGITVSNTIIENVSTPAQSDGLSTNPGNNNLTLTDSTIRNNWRGIYLNPGSGHVFSGNLIDGNNGSGVGIGSDGQSNFTLTGSVISNHTLEGWGASAVGAGVVAEGNSFVGNTVSVAHYGGSAIDANSNYWGSASGPGATVSGNVITVAFYTDEQLADFYAPVTNASASTYFSSIQAAIDAANPGDTIEVSAGTFLEDLALNKSLNLKGAGAGSTILTGPIGGAGNTIQISASNAAVSGFTITRVGNNLTDWNNSGLNAAGIGLLAPSISGVLIHDNLITGMRTGIDVNNTSDVTIRNNVVTNNHTGFILRNKTDNLLVEENEISNNRTVGILFLDASGGTNSPLQQALGSVFRNNSITGNWYGQIVDRQSGGSLPAPGTNVKNFVGNWTGSVAPYVSTANSAEPGYASLIPVVFGGTAEAPATGSQPDLAGPASANIVFTPLLASEVDTDVATQPGRGTFGFQGEVAEVDAPVKIVTLPGSPVHFQTLAEAVAAAIPGDVIELSPGTHAGLALTIDKALTILGANAGLAGVDPLRSEESRIFNMKLTLTVAGVVIDGVEVYQTNDTSEAVLVHAAATVRNSVIRRFGINTGIVARGITTAVGISGYNIENNLFSGDTSGGLFGGHKTWNSGIYLNGGSGTISGNTFASVRTAINVDDFNGGISISGNAFRPSGSYLAFGGATPTTGVHTIAGNDFGFDFNLPPASNPTLFNNSNVTTGFRLNVIGNTFGGVASGNLSNDQKFAIEARNFHRGRSSRNGVVDFVAGEQIVVPGTTIQSAVDASSSGGTVLIGVGTFAENVVTSTPLMITGRGLTTVIAPPSGVGISLASGGSSVSRTVLSNVAITGAGSGTGLVVGSYTTLDGVISTGHTNYGINLNSGTDLIIEDSKFDSNGNGLKLSSTASFTNIAISGSSFNNNSSHGWYDDANKTALPVLNNVTITGTSFNGNVLKGFYSERLSNAVFDNVTVAGNANSSAYNFGAGIDINLKWQSYSAITVRNSTFTNNGNGSLNGAALTIKARDDAPSYSAPAASLSGVLVEDCVFSNNQRHFVSGEPGKNNAGPTGVVIRQTNFGVSNAGAVVNHSVAGITATHNFWGLSNPNFGQIVVGSVGFSPWYADPARTLLVSASNFQNFTISPGQTTTFGTLLIGGGATWTVKGSLRVDGPFVLEEGATLEVTDGDVTFADGTTISGSLTFFNSFGSVHFNDDVAISGSADGLVLVSEVHVADGVTITVDGTFTIDGCTVDSVGTFDLNINSGADFTMARTRFSDGHIMVASGSTEIYDNRFTDATIAVTGTANGARVFHNLIDNLTDITDSGVGTVMTVDTWGNVTNPALTKNNLPLGLALSPALITAKRTLDSNGIAYIQPGDAFSATISVGTLLEKIVGVELLLGYNTDLVEADDLGLGANWDENLPFTEIDESNVIGRFNAAIGLDFSFPDPSGTNTAQTVGDLGLIAQAEGVTQVFHRVKFTSDTVPGTRLAKGFPGVGYLTPFTLNTPSVVIDDTDPLTNTLLTGATIEQDGQDMTQTLPATLTIQGTLEISASAFDALAGIDAVDAVVTLVGPATYTAAQVAVGPGPNIGGDDYTTYGFEYEVVPATLNGSYSVVFTVTDRSGNTTVQTLGSIVINKNQIGVTVELQGLITGVVNRNVTFVFTNAGNTVIETRVESVVFTNGAGTLTFAEVDGATASVSAKTSTHLRKKLPVAFSPLGQAGITYTTNTNRLLGGDLNADNVVNLLDYAVLRFYYLNQVSLVPAAAAAEITGDGSVNLTDYQILQSNFYQLGDAQ